MASQIFRVTRAPEAAPIDERQIRRMISVERDDSEWDVREMELRPARLVWKNVPMGLDPAAEL